VEQSKDTYLTVAGISEGLYKEKGSKFLAFVFPCDNKETAKTHLDRLRKEHRNACHVCFAWRFGTTNFSDRYSDDGEPANSAGKPIFGQILSFQLTNVLIAIVRYYGGTNLGVGGLITAYKTSSKEALLNATIQEKIIQIPYQINFTYPETGAVMNLLNKLSIEILSQGVDGNSPFILVGVKRTEVEKLIVTFSPLHTVKINLLENED
jgi:uncharacterized YigZ family protein